MLKIKEDKRAICISCCDSSKPAKEVEISRAGSDSPGEDSFTIPLCDDCLRKLAVEFAAAVNLKANTVQKLRERTAFLEGCKKYGNKDAEQQRGSYNTMMMYEIADLVDDMINIVEGK